ncbi:MAG: hypothetical protein AAGA71_19690 [Pseudomonadota bacterium]
MALIEDARTTWSSPVTLTSDEVWQARFGSVFVSTTASPAALDGIALIQGHGLHLRAGLQVRYRKEGPGAALLVREAV